MHRILSLTQPSQSDMLATSNQSEWTVVKLHIVTVPYFFKKRWPAVWTTNTRKHGHLSTSPSEDYMDLGYDLRWLIRQMTNQRSKTGTACDVMFRIDQSSQWIGSSVNKLHKPSVCPSAIHLISAPGRCPLTQREVSDLHYLCSHVSLLFSTQYSSVFA